MKASGGSVVVAPSWPSWPTGVSHHLESVSVGAVLLFLAFAIRPQGQSHDVPGTSAPSICRVQASVAQPLAELPQLGERGGLDKGGVGPSRQIIQHGWVSGHHDDRGVG